MSISVIIATFGDPAWRDLGLARAAPSAEKQDAQVVFGWDREWTISTARNTVAGRATGAWLCFLDADDELAPGFVGAMRRALEREAGADGSANLLLAPAVQTSPTRKPFFYPERNLRDANWLPIGTLVPRELFWRVGGFNESTPQGFEDWELWSRCAKAGARVVKVPDAVYRVHQERGSARSHAKLFRRDRHAYMAEYHRVRRGVYPELYEDGVACA